MVVYRVSVHSRKPLPVALFVIVFAETKNVFRKMPAGPDRDAMARCTQVHPFPAAQQHTTDLKNG